jgi:hypothetical protein
MLHVPHPAILLSLKALHHSLGDKCCNFLSMRHACQNIQVIQAVTWQGKIWGMGYDSCDVDASAAQSSFPCLPFATNSRILQPMTL